MQLIANGTQGPATVPTKQTPIGTPGYANSGPPGTFSATDADPDIFNTVLAEIANVVLSAGLTLDPTNNAQLLAAIKAVRGAVPQHGQCLLSATSTTGLTLNPFNGNGLIINGAIQSVPSGGVAYTASGLSASTLYYVYAEMVSGTMTLILSTTGHATSSANGVEIMSGDATKTLVGMVYATGATTVSVQPGQILNWFNRRMVSIELAAVLNSTSSATLVQVGPTETVLAWANGYAQMSAAG